MHPFRQYLLNYALQQQPHARAMALFFVVGIIILPFVIPWWVIFTVV